MILNKRQIEDLAREVGLIEPLFEDGLQAASYDMRLSNKWAITQLRPVSHVDPYGRPFEAPRSYLKLATAEEALQVTEWESDSYVLYPGDCVLAQSVEYFRFPTNLAGMVKAKSSLGRLFLSVSNGDACWFDPNFHGVAVLEIVNNNRFPICLEAGMKVGQMIFQEVDDAYTGAYDGNYQKQLDFASDRWLKALSKVGTNLKLGVKSNA